jgi:hypothetical protein
MSTKTCMVDKVTTNQAHTKKHCSLTHSFLDAFAPSHTQASFRCHTGRYPFVCMVRIPAKSGVFNIEQFTKEEPYLCWVWYTLKLVNRKWTCFWKPFMKAWMESNVEADNITCNLLYPHLEWKPLVIYLTLPCVLYDKCDHFQ